MNYRRMFLWLQTTTPEPTQRNGTFVREVTRTRTSVTRFLCFVGALSSLLSYM
jgi:hypothetical protein